MARYCSIGLLCTLLLLACNAEGAIPTLAYRLKPQIIREARYRWGMEQRPTVFFAQIHQESGWKADSHSPVGASGLAQFMPSTSEWISKLYPKELGENKPLDIRWAIRALVTYDKWLYDRIDSDEKWPMTLSSYNGGKTWLDRDRQLTTEKGHNDRFWFGNTEKHSKRSASAFNENRGYVRRIWRVLRPLYEKAGF